MQNQYVADVGDFGKYGLLRTLSGLYPDAMPRLGLGVVWHLTLKDVGRTEGELSSIDNHGKSHDAELHAEILDDDGMPWGFDLEAYSKLTPDGQKAYLKKLDDAMRGT